MNRRLRLRPLRRLPANRDGATAIEFALIAPVMILLYFGLLEFSQGFMAQRRASHAASVVSDLVAQSERTNRAGIDAIYAVGGLIMRPFPAAELSIRTTSISVDARGVATIEWSHGNGKALSPLQRRSRHRFAARRGREGADGDHGRDPVYLQVAVRRRPAQAGRPVAPLLPATAHR